MSANYLTITVVSIICFITVLFPLKNLPAQIHERANHQFPAFYLPAEMKTHGQMLTPTFSPKIRLKAGGVNMKVDTYTSVPCVVDWNNDKKKDLLVGCFYSGNVHLFLNSGTNEAPVFTTSAMLQADGKVISVAYG